MRGTMMDFPLTSTILERAGKIFSRVEIVSRKRTSPSRTCYGDFYRRAAGSRGIDELDAAGRSCGLHDVNHPAIRASSASCAVAFCIP